MQDRLGMKKIRIITILLCVIACNICNAKDTTAKRYIMRNGDTLSVQVVSDNAVRVRVLPVGHKAEPASFYTNTMKSETAQKKPSISFSYDKKAEVLTFLNSKGKIILSEVPNGRTLNKVTDNGTAAWQVAQQFSTPADDYQFGTGQFQDGNLNVKGLTRRLTQVNTQIALPMIISNKGYGILWNNCGMTDFNPADNHITLSKEGDAGETVTVNTTGTNGNKREERQYQTFSATMNIPEDGIYSILLDVGQSMARRHYIEIDGKVLFEANNLWLPPTTAMLAKLSKGEHKVTVRGEKNDKPSIHYRLSRNDRTTFSSPVAQTRDYTIFTGTADQIMATYRKLTGEVPMMPRWAFGYVHCRERYVSQDDVLSNAAEFRKRNIPLDIIVQDWQWWGKNGWNAMKFDSDSYPTPKLMTDSLHKQDIKLMLSVWAKIDKNSVLGKEMEQKGNYIPNTDWVDFFNKEAGNDYWQAYSANLLPTGIDAWWQDATEPENDDLAGRMVDKGALSGNAVRNIFPFAVNDVVYNGLLKARPNERPMNMTRSASPGIQRFGVLTWSGDIGNDYTTLECQIAGGLGQMACGVPWWTYDAGGFFRPGNQYNDEGYQKRMIRWIQNSVYLPVMRVHGYMSQTEPWRYSDKTYAAFVKAIRKRYNLFSYIYSEAAKVTKNGGTLMRPLVFDFPNDEKSLLQRTEYMLGNAILVCPATQDDIATQQVYLPETTSSISSQGSWTRIDDDIHVYAHSGSIIPWNNVDDNTKSTADVANAKSMTIRVFPGKNCKFVLYEDDGTTLSYQNNAFSEIPFSWNENDKTLYIHDRKGSFPKMPATRTFTIKLPDGTSKPVTYSGKAVSVSFKAGK